jgi:Na+/H+ antiporter NhaD/arsenite permease-like protein
LKTHMKTSDLEQSSGSKEVSAVHPEKAAFTRLSLIPIPIRSPFVWMRRTICHEITEHTFFFISLIVAAITSCFSMPRWSYIDLKVLVCLFELMLIVKALEEYGLLGHIAVNIVNRCRDERRLAIGLCVISFLLSMFTTNDVAIMTVIPILIIIAQTCGFSAAVPCVLITAAANLGSSTTPIGNPQNLYIFSFYRIGLTTFFRYSFPLCMISLFLLTVSCLFIRPRNIQTTLEDIPVIKKKKVTAFLLLAFPVIAGIMNLIPYAHTLLLVLLIAIILDGTLISKLDYRLLLTFLFLFVAVGNISHMPELNGRLAALTATPFKTYVSALLLSQIISNVPSAIMLAPFTTHIRALFYGVNIGGLGTPIASLASIIAYSLFCRAFAHKKFQFIRTFLLYNFGMLIILSTVFAVVIIFKM